MLFVLWGIMAVLYFSDFVSSNFNEEGARFCNAASKNIMLKNYLTSKFSLF